MMDNQCDDFLYVFSSHRGIKNFYSQSSQILKPKALGFEEFFDLCLSIKDLKKIPEIVQKALLLQTLYAYKKRNIQNLLIFDENFLAYLEGTEFLIQFFRELDSSKCAISDIPSKDIYGDYEDHLQILSEIYRHYHDHLKALQFYDHYSNVDFDISAALLSHYKGVKIYLDGILNPAELEVLRKVAEVLRVELIFQTDIYNLDFFQFLNLPLAANHSYYVHFKESSDILKDTIHHSKPNIQAYHFDMRIDQVSLAIAKAQEWLSKKTENVAIILPDESFASYLKVFDTNFNYAMGLDVRQNPYYKEVDAKLKDKQISEIQEIQELCERTLQKHHHPEIEAFNQRFFLSLAQILQKNSHLNLTQFYLKELQNLHLSDNQGGKIPVYGLLETRGIQFDSIVILDFNEENLFHLKDNDLFLNTSMRQNLKMPTLNDKKNLKKHYYHQLIHHSKNVFIGLVKTDMPQYFLESLKAEPKDFYSSIFFFDAPRDYQDEGSTKSLPQDFTFSASSLQSFLACPYQFYLKYIAKIQAPKKEDFNLGSYLHELLCHSYKQAQGDIKQAREVFEQGILTKDFPTLNDKLEAQIKLKKMQNFWEKEEKRSLQGQRFYEAERAFSFSFCSWNFTGKIDRIDKLNGGDGDVIILDYKFSKNARTFSLKDPNKIQLCLYRLALESEGIEVRSCNLVDFEGEYHEEKNHEEKLENLKQKLQELASIQNYEKCTDSKTCSYCPYTRICNRENFSAAARNY